MTKTLLNNTRNKTGNSSAGLNNRKGFFKSIILSICIFVGISGGVWGQVSLITASDGGFENATSAFSNNGWTAVGSSLRTWRVGTFGGYASGTKAAYWGTTTAYGGSASSAVGHFYRDIAIPAGATNVYLNYKLKYPTVDNTWDYFYVFTTTTANTPVNGFDPNNLPEVHWNVTNIPDGDASHVAYKPKPKPKCSSKTAKHSTYNKKASTAKKGTHTVNSKSTSKTGSKAPVKAGAKTTTKPVAKSAANAKPVAKKAPVKKK